MNEREARRANGFHVAPVPTRVRYSEPEFKELGPWRARRALARWRRAAADRHLQQEDDDRLSTLYAMWETSGDADR